MRPATLKSCSILAACALLAMATAVPAAAGEMLPAAAAPNESPPPAAQPQTVQAIGQALDSEALDALRGGETSVDTHVHDDGEVNGNSADGVTSGANFIGDGAFNDVAGISTVIQNSGSNVLIQNGTAVNVQFVDPVP